MADSRFKVGDTVTHVLTRQPVLVVDQRDTHGCETYTVQGRRDTYHVAVSELAPLQRRT